MVTRLSKQSRVAAASQARVESAAHLSGIAAAFSQAAALGPEVLALQTAVLAGLVSSQRQEAERIASVYGPDDERGVDVAARIDRFDVLNQAFVQHAEVSGRFIETFQRENIFHGYVTAADGRPAMAYGVRLEMLDASGQKQVSRATAKTDAAGYFRIDVRLTGRKNSDEERSGMKSWVERFSDLAGGDAAGPEDMIWPQAQTDTGSASAAGKAGAGAGGAPAPAGAARGAPPAAGAASTAADAAAPAASQSRVEILDSAGHLVFEDPMPPAFDGVSAEFRYYVLDAKGSAADKKSRTRR